MIMLWAMLLLWHFFAYTFGFFPPSLTMMLELRLPGRKVLRKVAPGWQAGRKVQLPYPSAPFDLQIAFPSLCFGRGWGRTVRSVAIWGTELQWGDSGNQILEITNSTWKLFTTSVVGFSAELKSTFM